MKTHPRKCIRNARDSGVASIVTKVNCRHKRAVSSRIRFDFAAHLRRFPALPPSFVRCHASHHEQRYARSSFGAFAVAIWCAAVARASPSVVYFLLPLTGHFEPSSTTDFSPDFSFDALELAALRIPHSARGPTIFSIVYGGFFRRDESTPRARFYWKGTSPKPRIFVSYL